MGKKGEQNKIKEAKKMWSVIAFFARASFGGKKVFKVFKTYIDSSASDFWFLDSRVGTIDQGKAWLSNDLQMDFFTMLVMSF